MAEEKQESQSESLHDKGITRITVGGFKSIAQEKSIEVRPLTILAGANSSGKSSIMQPLLLLKQTLDATYDPGPLLLNGPNVRFTLIDQLFSKTKNQRNAKSFHVGIETSDGYSVITYFERDINKRIDVEQTIYGALAKSYRLYRNMTSKRIDTALSTILNIRFSPSGFDSVRKDFSRVFTQILGEITLDRNRCFLTLTTATKAGIFSDTLTQNELVISPGLILAKANKLRLYGS